MGLVNLFQSGGNVYGIDSRGISLYRALPTCLGPSNGGGCSNRRYTSFGTLGLVYGATPGLDHAADCGALCGLSGGGPFCTAAAPPPACAAAWRGRGAPPDVEGEWGLVALRGQPSLVEGWVNGDHSLPAPLRVAGDATFAGVDQLRLGVFPRTGYTNGYLNGDVAELLVYDKALLPQVAARGDCKGGGRA